jgi:hypothetical protein
MGTIRTRTKLEVSLAAFFRETSDDLFRDMARIEDRTYDCHRALRDCRSTSNRIQQNESLIPEFYL